MIWTMIMDPEIIKSLYKFLPGRVKEVRDRLGRPLTLSEKILYSHLADKNYLSRLRRGIDYAEFIPDRVAMQDATAQMALLQFIVTGKEKTAVPASVHCDHLITGHMGAEKDLMTALDFNSEVYDFLSSVCSKYDIGFWKPGAGIIHQVILENYAFPGGLIIGTDSHTPTAGGLGMLAVGIGGADASDVMAGLKWELKVPEIIGVRLSGKLSGWASPKDVILKLAGLLTVKGGTDRIIEYFGDGARSVSCTGKATICNMGAETGATCSVFGYDNQMSDYLRSTGRAAVADLADGISSILSCDPEIYDSPGLYFDRVIEINLSELEPHINGPFTPDRAIPISHMKEEAEKNGWPLEISAGLIGSCTNSSFEDLSRSSSIIKNALASGLQLKSDFIVIPGSEKIRAIAEKEGFLDIFREAGGKIFANACGPCIGQWHRDDGTEMKVNTIIHSFNRNFAKRADGNPDTHAFVASPEIVTALSLAGDLTFNPLKDTLLNSEGKAVRLHEPEGDSLPEKGFDVSPEGYQEPAKDKSGVEVKIRPGSSRLQLLAPFDEYDPKDFSNMILLIRAKGKCTTDHISMAGVWLKFRGHLENISENYMTGAVNSFNGHTNLVVNQLTGKAESVPAVARAYKSAGISSVVVGEDNFGEGSSREHAALEPRYLGVKMIIVKSFARIHETNLKKQGILALTFAEGSDYERIKEDDRFNVEGLESFAEGSRIRLKIIHQDGSSEYIETKHSYNANQIAWFKAGSALNLIRRSNEKVNANGK